MNKKTIARIVSRVFDPTWWVPGLLALAAAWSIYNGLRWRFVTLLILIDGIIPFVYFVHLLRTREISDWDTTKKTQRRKLYTFCVVIHGIGIAIAWLLGKIILAKILLAFWILAVIFTAITFFWKISLHTGVAAAAVMFGVLVFDLKIFFLFLLVILIGWARIILKKHTFWQALAGAVLAPIVLWMMFEILSIDREKAQQPTQKLEFNHVIYE